MSFLPEHRVCRVLLALLLSGALYPLTAQTYQDEIKKEAGFWMGGAFPVPGTKASEALNSSLGGGGFFRMFWPNPFLLESGFSYANYKSSTMQQLTMAPVYGAVVYPLPWVERFSAMVKLGGGAANVVIRPANRSGWDPMAFAGFEFSILAAKRFRVGLRVDGYYLYENYRSEPKTLEYLRTYRALRGDYDPRFYEASTFKLYNPAFYNFGLMISFIL